MTAAVSHVSATRTRSSLGWLIFRVAGGTAIALAIASALTVVGIPVAILLFIFGAGMWKGANGTAKVKCPACGKEQRIFGDDEALKCRRCKQVTVVDWTH